MAARDPQEPEQDDRYGRPTIASDSSSARRPRWILIAVGIAVVALIAVIAYFVFYGGNGGGYGGGGGGGTGGGGYFIVAISADHMRRLKSRVLARR